MPCNRCNHNGRRRDRRRRGADENAAAAAAAAAAVAASDRVCCCDGDAETENIITDRFYCCRAPESIPHEFYSGYDTDTLISTCYDGSGLSYYDARRRCTFWPSFAHPRWLNCNELFNKETG